MEAGLDNSFWMGLKQDNCASKYELLSTFPSLYVACNWQLEDNSCHLSGDDYSKIGLVIFI